MIAFVIKLESVLSKLFTRKTIEYQKLVYVYNIIMFAIEY